MKRQSRQRRTPAPLQEARLRDGLLRHPNDLADKCQSPAEAQGSSRAHHQRSTEKKDWGCRGCQGWGGGGGGGDDDDHVFTSVLVVLQHKPSYK